MSRETYKYSDEDLNREYKDPWRTPKGTDDFLALIYFWFYYDEEDVETVGVWGFENKLHALKYLYGSLMEAEEYINREMFEEMKSEFINFIEYIKENRKDPEGDLGFASYDSGNNGLIIICHGYWDDVVKDIVDYIKEVLEHEYGHISGESQHQEHEHEELTEEEAGEYLSELRVELDACDRLMGENDVRSESFIKSFIEICDLFDARMNG